MLVQKDGQVAARGENDLSGATGRATGLVGDEVVKSRVDRHHSESDRDLIMTSNNDRVTVRLTTTVKETYYSPEMILRAGADL